MRNKPANVQKGHVLSKVEGFTLIELIVVIALLAALALGVLAALDPLEQIRKGQDTARRDVATQFYTAVIRYYASKEFMPVCTSATSCTVVDKKTLDSADWTAAKTRMKDAGELKSSYDDVYKTILSEVYGTGNSTEITVCYQPKSKTFKSDSNTKYTNADGTVACTPGPTADCYWCAR